jgi:hypothetical protein
LVIHRFKNALFGIDYGTPAARSIGGGDGGNDDHRDPGFVGDYLGCVQRLAPSHACNHPDIPCSGDFQKTVRLLTGAFSSEFFHKERL